MSASELEIAGRSHASNSNLCVRRLEGSDGAPSSQAERERILELARYFTAAYVVPVGLDGIIAPPDEAPRFTPDRTLTALAQLGAFRLDCDRSFISLIDRTHQYIIGEATRTTALSPENSIAAHNGLYLGFRVLELDFGVCPQTIQIFTSEGVTLDTPNISADQTHYVIRDFCADPHYSSRPYVTGFPHMRSYAEVPLISSSGFVIGSYCVVDTKPRSFDDRSILMLGEVASTIMDHLDLLKGRLDLDRANRLVRGLASYVDGYSGLQEQQTMSFPVVDISRPVAVHPRQAIQAAPTMSRDLSEPTQSSSSLSAACSTDKSGSALSDIESATESFGPLDSRLQGPSGDDVLRSGRDDQSSFQGHTNNFPEGWDSDSSSHGSTRRRFSGHSTDRDDELDDPVAADDTIDIGEDWLQRMLTNFPNGNIFSYDAMGVVHRTHLDTNNGNMLHPSRQIFGAPRLVETSADEHRDAAAEISRSIKDARSVFFLPMWNFQKDLWYAAAVGWTTDPARILDSGDLNYLSAFGNSIMAEVSRIETSAVSRAKSDFVASISHELRSPLHGVLAATELLRESGHSAAQLAMLESINMCGTMLLDTMNHLLDYAKISKLDQKAKSGFNVKSPRSPHEELIRLAVVDLGELVQDVVEGVYLGSSIQHSLPEDFTASHGDDVPRNGHQEAAPQPQNKQKQNTVLVLVDIETSGDWRFDTEIGAWKRIVMNLFGNALKYTSRGSITVSLCRKTAVTEAYSGSKPVQYICLQIIDTGHGISADYLKHHLFTPFEQEDGLSSGTGLGLSIVQQLVSNLDGHIKVQSTKGAGTSITVMIPPGPRARESSTRPETEQRAEPNGPNSGNSLQGHRLYFAPVDGSSQVNDDNADSDVEWSSEISAAVTAGQLLCKFADHRLGMKVLPVSDLGKEGQTRPDAYFVVSPRQTSISQIGLEWTLKSIDTSSDTEKETVVLSQPFTPRKMVAALLRVSQLIGTPSALMPEPNELRQRSPEEHKQTDPEALLASPRPPQPEQVSGRPAHQHDSSQSFNVLLVDDNPINLRVLATCLSRLGCIYTEAVNGQDAFEAYRTSPNVFDLIFMDLSMPVMDGFAATHAIRAHESASQLSRSRIVALTALGSSDTRGKAYASGVDMFVSKPVRMADVRAMVLELRSAQVTTTPVAA